MRTPTIGTGVTCPTIRTHPAVIAQAAATSGAMMPGRFFLGVGSGEALNEHVVGQRWPETEVRLAMLEDAVAVMRLLWQGGNQSHHGQFNAVQLVTPEKVKESVVIGPDANQYLAKIDEYALAGFDHIYIHQVGPDQEGFIRFAVREILPHFGVPRARAA